MATSQWQFNAPPGPPIKALGRRSSTWNDPGSEELGELLRRRNVGGDSRVSVELAQETPSPQKTRYEKARRRFQYGVVTWGAIIALSLWGLYLVAHLREEYNRQHEMLSSERAHDDYISEVGCRTPQEMATPTCQTIALKEKHSVGFMAARAAFAHVWRDSFVYEWGKGFIEAAVAPIFPFLPIVIPVVVVFSVMQLCMLWQVQRRERVVVERLQPTIDYEEE